MRNYTALPIFMLLLPLMNFSQNPYSEGMMVKRLCPCEKISFMTDKQYYIPMRPFMINGYCTHNPIAVQPKINGYPSVFEMIFHRKRLKKRGSPTYPKISNIIRF